VSSSLPLPLLLLLLLLSLLLPPPLLLLLLLLLPPPHSSNVPMAHSRPPSLRPFSPNLRRIYDAAAAAATDDDVDDDKYKKDRSRTASIMKESPQHNSTNLYHCSA
jgi:hypothetical protein